MIPMSPIQSTTMSVETSDPATPTRYINDRVVDVPLRILNQGPEYLRSRMMNRDSALFRHNRRSAVELLAQTKPLYVKTDVPEHGNQDSSSNRKLHVHEDDVIIRDNKQIGDEATTPNRADREPVSKPGVPRRGGPPPVPPRKPHLRDRYFHKPAVQSSIQPEPDDGVKSHGHRLIPPPPPPPVKPQCIDNYKPTTKFISDSGDRRTKHYNNFDKSSEWESSDNRTTKPRILPPPPPPPSQASLAYMRSQLLNNHVNLKRPRYNGIAKTAMMNARSQSPKEQKKFPTDVPTISADESQETRTSTSSETGQSSQCSSKGNQPETVVHRRTRKVLSRSRSDLTKRLSNSSDFSELSARFNRNSADLEKFFNEMGLDHAVLEPLRGYQCSQAESTNSLNIFDSVSCVGSAGARSCLSDDSQRSSGHLKPHDGSERTPIVERNARIIKWLCNIKMASSHQHLAQTTTPPPAN